MKIKLAISATAVIGLLAFQAGAQSEAPAYLMNFKLTGLMPAVDSPIESSKSTATSYSHTTKYVANKVKITNKEILSLLAAESGMSFPPGATLAGSEGNVYVADSSGTNFLYGPEFDYGALSEGVEAGTGTGTYSSTATGTKETYTQTSTHTGIGSLRYIGVYQFFNLAGLTTQNYSTSESTVETHSGVTETTKSKLSFTVTGAGTGFVEPTGGNGVVSGTVTGTKTFSSKETY